MAELMAELMAEAGGGSKWRRLVEEPAVASNVDAKVAIKGDGQQWQPRSACKVLG